MRIARPAHRRATARGPGRSVRDARRPSSDGRRSGAPAPADVPVASRGRDPSNSPRGARAAIAARIEVSPARSAVEDTVGRRAGAHSSRGEIANVPIPLIARIAPSVCQAAPRDPGVPDSKPYRFTLRGPRGADGGTRQTIPAAPSRYSAEANAASTEPRPAMRARRADRPMLTAVGAAPRAPSREPSIRAFRVAPGPVRFALRLRPIIRLSG